MRCKPADGAARDPAAQLHRCNHFFHTRDRRPRKGFTVELHAQAAILRLADLDGGGVLARTAEEKFTKAVAFAGIVISGASQDKSTGPVAKQATKLAGDSAGSERSTVDVGGDNRYGLRLPRTDQRLRDGQGIEQTEAGAANIQRTTILAHEQSGMKLG